VLDDEDDIKGMFANLKKFEHMLGKFLENRKDNFK